VFPLLGGDGGVQLVEISGEAHWSAGSSVGFRMRDGDSPSKTKKTKPGKKEGGKEGGKREILLLRYPENADATYRQDSWPSSRIPAVDFPGPPREWKTRRATATTDS